MIDGCERLREEEGLELLKGRDREETAGLVIIEAEIGKDRMLVKSGPPLVDNKDWGAIWRELQHFDSLRISGRNQREKSARRWSSVPSKAQSQTKGRERTSTKESYDTRTTFAGISGATVLHISVQNPS